MNRIILWSATAALVALAGCGSDDGTCSITNNADGTSTITCDDGTTVTVGGDDDSCTIVNNGDGTATITCDDGTSATVVLVFEPAVFAHTGAVQTFTVPAGATSVEIVALGASGGNTSTFFGGHGATVTATAAVTGGQVLTIIVGGQPGAQVDGLDGCGASGGGGSFVVLGSSTLLASAGGGAIAHEGGGGAGFLGDGTDGNAGAGEGGTSFANGSLGGARGGDRELRHGLAGWVRRRRRRR